MTWPFLGSIWNDWWLFSWSSFLPWILVQWLPAGSPHHSDHPFLVPLVEVPVCCHLLISCYSSSQEITVNPPLCQLLAGCLLSGLSPWCRSFSWAPNCLLNAFWISTASPTSADPKQSYSSPQMSSPLMFFPLWITLSLGVTRSVHQWFPIAPKMKSKLLSTTCKEGLWDLESLPSITSSSLISPCQPSHPLQLDCPSLKPQTNTDSHSESVQELSPL